MWRKKEKGAHFDLNQMDMRIACGWLFVSSMFISDIFVVLQIFVSFLMGSKKLVFSSFLYSES